MAFGHNRYAAFNQFSCTFSNSLGHLPAENEIELHGFVL
jgi:hypothetical protein